MVGYPLAFYSPETSAGFGGYGLIAFRLKNQNDSVKPSQFAINANYTLLNQLSIYAPYQFFLGNKGSYLLSGELGYYEYFYRFFGVGNELPKVTDEFYKVIFPRIKLNGFKRINQTHFIGASYAFDNFNIVERDPEGLLVKDSLTGSSGGVLSGVGPSYRFDSRNNIFFPSKGWFIEFLSVFNEPFLGSTFSYGKVEYVATTYLKDKHANVWALNYTGGFNTGNPPVNDFIQYGGGKAGRGVFRGKYRDRIMNLTQVEYRYTIWKRFGGVAFTSVGGVSDKFSNYALQYTRVNYGLGLRYQLSKSEKINLRLDVGFGDGSPGVYISVGEAF